MYYSLLFIISLPILYVFFVFWYVPSRSLPYYFIWFITAATMFQIGCTVIPETGKVKTIIHRLLTGISGAALLPAIFIIAIAANLPNITRAVAWLIAFIMTILLCIALANQRGYRWALLLQIGYYGAFFAAILVTTYFAS